MAKIVDPDSLSYTLGTPTTEEIAIDTGAKTIELRVAGNLDDTSPAPQSGATLQAVHSKLKEIWRTDTTLNKHKYPFDPIFEAKFDMQNGWSWANAQSRDLIRDAGWKEIDLAEYATLVSLGDVNADADQSYYQQVAGFDLTADNSVTDFDKTGELNEPVQIKGTGGTPDYTGFNKVFLRIQGKTYDQGDLINDLNLSALTYVAYSFPLANEADITDGSGAPVSDVTIDGNTPYTGMSVAWLLGTTFDTAAATTYSANEVLQDGAGRWFFVATGGTVDAAGAADYTANGGTATLEAFAGEKAVGSSYYAFNTLITGNNGDKKEIYEWAQRQLRKTTDINAADKGTPNQDDAAAHYGRIVNPLCYFIGSTLHTEGGVWIDGFDTNDTNNIVPHDITVDSGGLDSEGRPVVSTGRTFPFVAAGTMIFNDFLTDEPDVDTKYTMYFQYTYTVTNTGFGTSGVSGSTATIDSSTTNLTTYISSGDVFYLDGFTNTENNGLWEATGAPAGSGPWTVAATKLDGQTVVNESAAASVTFRTHLYDTDSAIIVDDNSSTDITGQITASSIAFDFDYTNNTQGNRTAATDAPVSLVAIGKAGAQWVVGDFTIAEATGQSFPVNAPQERVYST